MGFQSAIAKAESRAGTAQLITRDAFTPALEAAWRGLATDVAEPNIFYEPCLLIPALERLCENDELRLFLLWEGEPGSSSLCGLLPVAPTWQFGRWRVPHVQNWTHPNCFLGTPLVRRGFETAFWAALFDELDNSRWGGFFHIAGLTIDGPIDRAMRELAERQSRRCDLVHSEARAFLESDLGPEAYYAATVRNKKRKELRRQHKRLSELGEITIARHRDRKNLRRWMGEFLELERRGWKGEAGSAIDVERPKRYFFKEALRTASVEGRLERIDIRLDGRPIAMLTNFICPPGSFSFKTAFDEDYARFSPGVLLQLENMKILDDPDIAWMDSCAAQDHPMIDSLWSGRRHIGRFSIELGGLQRRTLFRAVRIGEDLMARIKGREIVDIGGPEAMP